MRNKLVVGTFSFLIAMLVITYSQGSYVTTITGGGSTLTGFTTADNTGLGVGAGTSITSAISNTLVGHSAGGAISSATMNTAVGKNALSSVTTQANGQNIAVGLDALRAVTTGNQNIGIGNNAGDDIIGGSRNISIGHAANTLLISGVDTISIGNQAGQSTTASENIYIGSGAASAATSGVDNVCIGHNVALLNITDGRAIGIGANVTTTEDSIVMGNSAAVGVPNVFVAGATGSPINGVYFGKGISNAAPTTYTIGGTWGSGTNIAGAGLNLAGGRSTGTAASGSVSMQTAGFGSSGTTLNTLVDRFITVGKGLALSDNTATTIATITVPTTACAGGKVTFTVEVTNGTDTQSCSGEVFFNAINKADTFTTDSTLTASTLATTGTLVVSFSFTTDGPTDAVNLRVTSDTSLTATVHRIWYSVINDSQRVITLP